MQKREFLKSLALSGIFLPSALEALAQQAAKSTPGTLAIMEDFWEQMRKDYRLNPDYINLENGYYSMMPEATLESYIKELRALNYEASHFMRTKMPDDGIRVRQTLANFMKCSLEEMIITRNTTESMDTVIAGFDWKPGDEAVMAHQDYGAMLDMFHQQSRRYGMVNRLVTIPAHPKSDEEIVEVYRKAITSKTRLLMVCHMINITGQILPVRKICDMAHEQGVEVIVDGAHAVAHIEFNLPELNCDYYASSLHKWLSVPLGAGMLYVKKEKVAKLWPVFGDRSFADDDIRKLNHTGTQPWATLLTIPHAIRFHEAIGGKPKEERLRYLKDYWTSQVSNLKGIHLNTPLEASRSCAIANVGIAGKKPGEIAKTLMEKYKIWTVAIDHTDAGVKGIRVTPSVFTTTAELDKLVSALREMAV